MSLRGNSRCFSFWVEGLEAETLDQFIRDEQGRAGADLKKSAIIRKLVMKGLNDAKGERYHRRPDQPTPLGAG